MDILEKLYLAAKEQYHPEEVSLFVYTHHVVCAIESENGEIYTGFCIEGCSGMPCGACREFLMQLSYENRNIEIMTDYKSRQFVLLGELIPGWWGEERYRTGTDS